MEREVAVFAATETTLDPGPGSLSQTLRERLN